MLIFNPCPLSKMFFSFNCENIDILKNKWISSSTSCLSHLSQILSFKGVIGLVYLPTYIFNLWELILNFVIYLLFLCSFIITRYFSKSKFALICTYVLNFLDCFKATIGYWHCLENISSGLLKTLIWTRKNHMRREVNRGFLSLLWSVHMSSIFHFHLLVDFRDCTMYLFLHSSILMILLSDKKAHLIYKAH
jgi:hypothetical protein